ncbi:hypothetical protein Hanom_Chr00s000002g01600591 [Helianthus anomalus]
MPKESISGHYSSSHTTKIFHGVIFYHGVILKICRTLPWWDVDELVKTKNIKQFYFGLEVKQHDQRLWNYIKWQAKNRYPDWKPQKPKQIVTILEDGEKDITLDVKPPRCLKNMPLRAMEYDFHDLFEGWLDNETTAEAVISLFNKSTRKS